jgi:hypothetical protein
MKAEKCKMEKCDQMNKLDMATGESRNGIQRKECELGGG